LSHLGAGSVYYYVVLNGFHMHEQKITSYTTNRKVRLGRGERGRGEGEGRGGGEKAGERGR
jgi:hypothetical protein